MKNLFLLRCALVLVGLVFLFGLFPLMNYWPSGWRWNPFQYKYEQMILGIYATLGVFLIIAAWNPLANLSLIRFTIWSSVVHATIMLIQTFFDFSENLHLLGDIPALYIVAIVLAILIPKNHLEVT